MLEISMEKRYLENLGADGMTVMKRVTKKNVRGCGLNKFDSGYRLW